MTGRGQPLCDHRTVDSINALSVYPHPPPTLAHKAQRNLHLSVGWKAWGGEVVSEGRRLPLQKGEDLFRLRTHSGISMRLSEEHGALLRKNNCGGQR